MAHIKSTIDRFKQSEHTGKNRCTPCTIVNSLIAVVASVAVAGGLVFAGRPAYAAPAAGAVVVVSAAIIYLRGYLVPGTPTLTRKYFPRRVLAWFGKARATVERPASTDGGTADAPEGRYDIDVEETLLRAGAVETCRDGTDFCLTDEFQAAWEEKVATVRNEDAGRERLLDVLDADEDVEIEFQDYEGSFEAEADGRHIGTWESEAAYFSDVAAGLLLSDRIDGWHDYSSMVRGQVLQGLRIFLETCPACDGRLSFGTETVESCCGSEQDVAAVTCEDCGSRVFEAAIPEGGERAQPP